MPGSSLNFNVTLFPFRESNFPVFNLIGVMLEPLSHAFEVRLSGTLAKPEWTLAAGTESLPSTGTPATPPPPPGPGTAKTSPTAD